MSNAPAYSGPLHLRSHLGDCHSDLEASIRNSVHHSVSTIRSIVCSCTPGNLARILEKEGSSNDPAKQQAALDRKEKLNTHRSKRISKGNTTRLFRVSPSGRASGAQKACPVFAVEVNEEDGIVRGICRRCQKLFVVFDRSLYWGLRRDHAEPPESFAYRCVCGGHSFEIGVGFDYSDDSLDENDFHTVTVAVRCCACDSISMILDEEG